MTMHERRDIDLDAIREVIARTSPEQIRRLVEEIMTATPSERPS